jgi:transposase
MLRRLPHRRPSPSPRLSDGSRVWPIRPTPAPRSALTCAWRGIQVTIPEPADQARNRVRRGSKGGRPPAFDAAAYKQRNVVERAFCQLRQHRAVATRYDKRDFVRRGTVDVASIRIWLHHPAT